MKTNMLIVLLATLSTGIMAGIFFTWSNAVKPGIGKLTDMGYLESLQAMNKVILNPLFYMLFIAAVILMPIAAFLQYNAQPMAVFRLLTVASALHLTGVFLVTLLGNIPLNHLLENTNLATLTALDAEALRNAIEEKWNRYNLIRTLSSCIAFAILLVTLTKMPE